MAFDDGTQNLIRNVDDSLKLLHDTIQKQIKATNRQANIMIALTVALVIFTVALFFVAVYQVGIIETNTKYEKTQNYEDRSQNNNNIGKDTPKK